MGNEWFMMDIHPVVMRRNLPAVTSETYGKYPRNYEVE